MDGNQYAFYNDELVHLNVQISKSNLPMNTCRVFRLYGSAYVPWDVKILYRLCCNRRKHIDGFSVYFAVSS